MNVILAKIRLLAFKKTNDRIFCPKDFFSFAEKAHEDPEQREINAQTSKMFGLF